MYVHMHMVKVISLSNEAYGRLKALKIGDKSFSEIVIEITPEIRKKNLMDFFGIWKDEANEWKEIEKKIYKDRKKFKLKEVKF